MVGLQGIPAVGSLTVVSFSTVAEPNIRLARGVAKSCRVHALQRWNWAFASLLWGEPTLSST